MSRAVWLGLGLLLGWLTAAGWEQATPARVVVDPETPDVAMTFPAEREIHVNPTLLALVPPNLGSFLFLHEQGHIVLAHDGKARGKARRAQELAADCWAARRASVSERLVAIRHLGSLGPIASATHPGGTARAAEVARCSP